VPATPRLVCLVPARNAARFLPAFLRSAERFCDAVVALDDGSTDATADILEASPLVSVLLRNPRRHSFEGWHDGANRNRLLRAAADLGPDWIVSIDADETLDQTDSEALRTFVQNDAVPGCAFGFQHFRMWGPRRYDPRPSTIFRLFAFRPGQTFADERLHFIPVPVDIPRGGYLPTTIRVQHWAVSTEARRRARVAKYREADPAGEYPTAFGGLDDLPDESWPTWHPRLPGLPVLAPGLPAGHDIFTMAPGRVETTRPTLVCLLPVRNGEDLLPGYLGSVRTFADAVVALDDGSTDRTPQILAADPLVAKLLSNPGRPGYAGWNDAANRARLLEAAKELDPAWVLFLDADERIDPDDAAVLRRFAEQEAVPGFAYGFRVHRMVEDLDHYDRAELWVYRMFAPEPWLSLPAQQLHLVPVPETIPPERRVPTTVRIQHLASLTEEGRRRRFEKYAETDPDHRYQPSYAHLLEAPEAVRAWPRRPPGLPVVAAGALDLHALDLDAPVLSAVVIAQNDQDIIERTVRSVVEQECPQPFEVIVVCSGTDATAAIVRRRFPQVRLVELDHPALPGEARNAGVRVARGDYVSFPGSHVELLPGSLAARVRAHELGYPMVTGTMLNGTDTPAGWASYFLDHAGVLPGRPSMELSAPPAHCSYAREFLVRVGGFPEDMRAGEDTVVNIELYRRGFRAFRAQDVVLVHHSRCSDLHALVRHHFVRGRALGRIIADRHLARRDAPLFVDARRPAPPAVLRDYVRRRVRTIQENVGRWGGDLAPRYEQVRPLVVAGASAALAGAWFETLRRATRFPSLLVRQPVLTAVLLQRPDRQAGAPGLFALIQFDLLGGEVRVARLPGELLSPHPNPLQRVVAESLSVPVDGVVEIDLGELEGLTGVPVGGDDAGLDTGLAPLDPLHRVLDSLVALGLRLRRPATVRPAWSALRSALGTNLAGSHRAALAVGLTRLRDDRVRVLKVRDPAAPPSTLPRGGPAGAVARTSGPD
jgi:glycosyltransferase involved in cell wall biosynthesis